MPRIVYLDTGPLGLACHSKPAEDRESGDFQFWIGDALANRVRIIIPAIADYEIRRELIRSHLTEPIAQLDLIESGRHPGFPNVIYLPLSDEAIKRAANLWAEARNQGYPTAQDKALDGDVIVAAQALEHAGGSSRFLIATSNVKDIARYVGKRAKPWSAITP